MAHAPKSCSTQFGAHCYAGRKERESVDEGREQKDLRSLWILEFVHFKVPSITLTLDSAVTCEEGVAERGVAPAPDVPPSALNLSL